MSGRTKTYDASTKEWTWNIATTDEENDLLGSSVQIEEDGSYYFVTHRQLTTKDLIDFQFTPDTCGKTHYFMWTIGKADNVNEKEKYGKYMISLDSDCVV